MPSKHKMRRRGIVGIEAAIVLIAFVIVAAALAFVVLNMGFTTTQKSKEAMVSGLKEASSALEIDGTVVGVTGNDTQGQKAVFLIAIPLKLASGKHPIDMSKTTVSLMFVNASDTSGNWVTTTVKLENNTKTGNDANTDVVAVMENWSDGKPGAELHIYSGDTDNIFEGGEKALLYVYLNGTDAGGAPPYTKVLIEIKPPEGAPLTIERYVPPNLSDQVVVLEG